MVWKNILCRKGTAILWNIISVKLMGTGVWWQIQLFLEVLVKEMDFGCLLLHAWKVAWVYNSTNSMSPGRDPRLPNTIFHTTLWPLLGVSHITFCTSTGAFLGWPGLNKICSTSLTLPCTHHSTPTPQGYFFSKLRAMPLARNGDDHKNTEKRCVEPMKWIYWQTIHQQIPLSVSF